MSAAIGVYVHIPFCVQKCLYCDFASCGRASGVHARSEEYVDSLLKEIELRAVETGPLPVRSVFLGGGTPTVLAPAALARILDGVIQHYDVSQRAEVTVEANPGTVGRSELAALRQAGFNRISLGVQSFSDAILRRLGRIHSAQQAVRTFWAARDAGFENINLDLMFGVPGQTGADWLDSLEAAQELRPEHIAAYSLIVEEDTTFGRWYDRGLLDLPDDDVVADMMEWTPLLLRDSGLERYEISNYARPGFESVHNQIYWENAPYLGFGAAAFSYWQKSRYANTTSVSGYIESLARGVFPVVSTESMDVRGEMGETIMLGLRMTRGVNLVHFRKRFGVDLVSRFAETIKQQTDLGLIQLDDTKTHLQLTPRGLQVANHVMAEFL